MKLLRYGAPGAELPGILDANNQIRDLSGEVGDIAGEVLLPGSLQRLASLDINTLPIVSGTPRLGPCVSGTGKYICIGLNYIDHAAEATMNIPNDPIVIMK